MTRPYLWVFGASALWLAAAATGLAVVSAQQGTARTPDRAAAEVVGAADCSRCHPQEHASWRASYHRTMTQAVGEGVAALELGVAPAQGAEILAPFAGEEVRYGDFVATMDRDAQGRPRMRVRRANDPQAAPILDANVELSVGSHRYQQYVGRLPGDEAARSLSRLPLAWHRGEARWIHLNGAFVEPEGATDDADAYLRHVTTWNNNCVFCHNTEPAPGAQAADGPFETRVGELGIACEACHGKGSAHTAAHANPLGRMLARGDRDPSIADPLRMSPAREADVCGRCHGNRIARDISKVLSKGDGFVPGTKLSDHSRPIMADSQLNGTDGAPFSARFWPDKSPRLSAYEYQGMRMSACHSRGELRCGDCHDMHGDTPELQLRAGSRTAACERCHPSGDLSGSEGAQGHGAHTTLDTPAPDCVDCHMPRTTYGLLEGMVSHWVRAPDPSAWLGHADQPDACTQCHVDQSRVWAADVMPALRRGLLVSAADTDSPRAPAAASRVAQDLFGGDPLQRNLAAHAMGRDLATGAQGARLALLLEALDDSYPAVRWFAWQSARRLARRATPPLKGAGLETLVRSLEDFDYLGPASQRVEAVALMRASLEGLGVRADGALGLSREARLTLNEGADDEPLWIGE